MYRLVLPSFFISEHYCSNRLAAGLANSYHRLITTVYWHRPENFEPVAMLLLHNSSCRLICLLNAGEGVCKSVNSDTSKINSCTVFLCVVSAVAMVTVSQNSITINSDGGNSPLSECTFTSWQSCWLLPPLSKYNNRYSLWEIFWCVKHSPLRQFVMCDLWLVTRLGLKSFEYGELVFELVMFLSV